MALKGPKASTASAKPASLRAKAQSSGKTRVRVKVDSAEAAKAKAGSEGGEPFATAADARSAPGAATSWIAGHKKELAIVAGALAAAFILYRIVQGLGGTAAAAAPATTTDPSGDTTSPATTTTPSATTTPTTTVTTASGGPVPTGLAYGAPSPAVGIVTDPVASTSTPAKKTIGKDPKHDIAKHPPKGKTATHPARNTPWTGGFTAVTLHGTKTPKTVGVDKRPKGQFTGAFGVIGSAKPHSDAAKADADESKQGAKTGTAKSHITVKAKSGLGGAHVSGAHTFAGAFGAIKTQGRSSSLPSPHEAQTAHKTAAKAGVSRSVGSTTSKGTVGSTRAKAAKAPSQAVVRAAHPAAKATPKPLAKSASAKPAAVKPKAKTTARAAPKSVTGHAGVRKA